MNKVFYLLQILSAVFHLFNLSVICSFTKVFLFSVFLQHLSDPAASYVPTLAKKKSNNLVTILQFRHNVIYALFYKKLCSSSQSTCHFPCSDYHTCKKLCILNTIIIFVKMSVLCIHFNIKSFIF